MVLVIDHLGLGEEEEDVRHGVIRGEEVLGNFGPEKDLILLADSELPQRFFSWNQMMLFAFLLI